MSPPAAICVLARPASAVSAEAQHVLDSAAQLVARVESSMWLFGRKMAVMTMLDSLTTSHAENGWDGEQALPASHAAIGLAADFIRALPDDIDMPDVGVEPDGAVTLDWLPSRHRMLSVSFGGSGNRLAYAWLDGSDRGSGVVRFNRQAIPRTLMEAIAMTTEFAGHAGVRAA
ncbi:hypothetical protein [Metallibacterium scheffleri]|uniref:hypothetical protein n=1 Tax=Metallibacterium scheffleri TaxID=993689 RepID=UPI0023F31F05|nr:hypothetical protein [Metallibacterium scheffleri]